MKHFIEKLHAIHNIIHSSEFKLAGKRIRKGKEFHFCNDVQPSSAWHYEVEFNEGEGVTFSYTRSKLDPHPQRSKASQAEDCGFHHNCCCRESGQQCNPDTPESSKIEDQNIM